MREKPAPFAKRKTQRDAAPKFVCVIYLCATRPPAKGDTTILNLHSTWKLREKLDYMHANPVRAKLVKHPRDWPWSSWSYYATGEGLLRMDVV
jgi:hypothetical protein